MDAWESRNVVDVDLSESDTADADEGVAVLLGSRAALVHGVERVAKGPDDVVVDWDVVASVDWLRQAARNAGQTFDEQHWASSQQQPFVTFLVAWDDELLDVVVPVSSSCYAAQLLAADWSNVAERVTVAGTRLPAVVPPLALLFFIKLSHVRREKRFALRVARCSPHLLKKPGLGTVGSSACSFLHLLLTGAYQAHAHAAPHVRARHHVLSVVAPPCPARTVRGALGAVRGERAAARAARRTPHHQPRRCALHRSARPSLSLALQNSWTWRAALA